MFLVASIVDGHSEHLLFLVASIVDGHSERSRVPQNCGPTLNNKETMQTQKIKKIKKGRRKINKGKAEEMCIPISI